MATCTVPHSIIDTTATFNLAAQYLQLFANIVSTQAVQATVDISSITDIDWPSGQVAISYPSVPTLLADWASPERPETPEFDDEDQPVPFNKNASISNDLKYRTDTSLRNRVLSKLYAITIPTLDFSGKPAPFAESPPDLTFYPSDYTLPSAPTETQPTPPIPRQIVIPQLSTLNVSEIIEKLLALTDQAPVRITPPKLRYLETFNSQTPAVLGSIATHVATFNTAYGLDAQTAGEVILEMLQTGAGLPVNVEFAMRSRATAETDRNLLAAQDGISKRYADLGHDIPTGAEIRALREAYQQSQTAKAQLSRDIFINAAERAQSNRIAAIQAAQAIRALISQEVLQGLGLAEQVAGRFATLVVEYYRAEQQGELIYYQALQAMIGALDSILRAELSKLEQDRNRIELARLIGTLNEQDVAIYRARIEAWTKLWDAYETQLNAVRAIVQIDESRADVLGKQADIYRTQWEAKREEFRAWGESIQAEVAKLQGSDIQARIAELFARVYGIDVDAAAREGELQSQRNNAVLQVLQALAETHRSDNAFRAARVDTKGRIFATLAQMYSAELAESDAIARIDIANIQSNLSRAADEARADLQAQQINRDEALEQVRIGLTALQEQARLKTAIFGSAAAALNVNVSSSHSGSGSVSSSYSHDITCDP